MIRTIAVSAVLALTLVTPHACRDTGNGGGDDKANTQITCAAIHTAINGATLDTHAAETELKLDAARPGVPDRIGTAIDSYYRGDHDAARQEMLVACAAAGFPA